MAMRRLTTAIREGKNQKQESCFRNWLDLPQDIMILICAKLGTETILDCFQFVCSSWWKLSNDPFLHRSTIILSLDDLNAMKIFNNYHSAVAKKVFDSCGDQLRSLTVKGCIPLYIHCKVLYNHFLLEDLEWEVPFGKVYIAGAISKIGCSSPLLKHLRLTVHYRCVHPIYTYIAQGRNLPHAIAECMPQLQSLHLSFRGLRDEGLREIIDRCIHLKHLDLRGCSLAHVKSDTIKHCIARFNDFAI